MKTTEAMERLAGADPFPEGLPTPPLEPLLRSLEDQQPQLAAARQVAAPGVASRGLGLSWMLPATAALVAIAVLVGAVALLGHHGAQSQSAGGRARSQSLLSQFSILRRPQTPRDRQLPWMIISSMLAHPGQQPAVLPSLTRVVGELPSRGAGPVLLLVIAHGTSRAHPRDMWLMMVTSGPNGAGAAGGGPYTESALFPMIGDGYASQLVPDAVRRVKWSFPGRTIYPSIRDNVAVAPASLPGGTGSPLKSVTWYGADGRVLAYENAATLEKRQAANEQRAIARAVSHVLLLSFPVLSRPRTAADQLPSALQTIVERDRSLAPWLSQRVDIPGSRLVDWIVPGLHGYCRFDLERLPKGPTVTPALAQHCVPASSLITQAITLTASSAAVTPGATNSSGQTLATALLPNTVTSVTIVHPNGASVPVPITHGLIAARVSAGDRIYLLINSRRHLALTIRTSMH